MKKIFLYFTVVIIYCFLVIPAKASTIALEISDSYLTIYTLTDAVRGWTFDVNSAVKVESLGILDYGSNGLLQSHDIAIWNTSTQTIMAQDTLTDSNTILEGPADAYGQFRFKPLDTIVTLLPGQYTIGTFYPVADSPSLMDYYLANADAVKMASQFNWLDGVYDTSGSFVIPTTSISGFYNNAYWGPNFKFSPVPEPATMLLLGTGLVGVAGAARRKKKNQA